MQYPLAKTFKNLPVTEVLHLQSREIARPKFAIDCEIEHRELPDVRRHLKSRSD